MTNPRLVMLAWLALVGTATMMAVPGFVAGRIIWVALDMATVNGAILTAICGVLSAVIVKWQMSR